jgi:hypothetical protein
MEKKTYYVSVQAGTVLENEGDAAFEFEISATPEEVDKLAEMFESAMEADHDAFWRAHTLAIPYHHDDENDTYDDSLKMIYQTIYELGTPETKRHIESMNVLPNP